MPRPLSRPSNLEEDSPQEPGRAAGLGRAGGMRTSVCGQCRSYPRARSISPQLVMSSELREMDILKPEALRTKSRSASGRRERHTWTLPGLPGTQVELGSSPRLRSSPFAFTHFLQTFSSAFTHVHTHGPGKLQPTSFQLSQPGLQRETKS